MLEDSKFPGNFRKLSRFATQETSPYSFPRPLFVPPYQGHKGRRRGARDRPPGTNANHAEGEPDARTWASPVNQLPSVETTLCPSASSTGPRVLRYVTLCDARATGSILSPATTPKLEHEIRERGWEGGVQIVAPLSLLMHPLSLIPTPFIHTVHDFPRS